MRSNRPTIADAEVRLRTFRNITSATIARGTPVFYAAISDSGAGSAPNGISVHLCPSSGRVVSLFAGIVYPDLGIAAGDYGECQVSGACDYALVTQDAGNTINIGEYLQGVVGGAYLARFPAATFTRVVLMETIVPGVTVAARRVLLFGGA